MNIKLNHSHSILFLSGLAISLLLSAAPVQSLFAQDVPNSFVSGTTASAVEVNQNFSNLDTRLDTLEAALAESSPMVFLGGATYLPSTNSVPVPVAGGADYLLAQVVVTVLAPGKTIVRLGTNVGNLGTGDYVGTLYVDGVVSPLLTPPFVVPAGATGAMGLSQREFVLPLPQGTHTLELMIRNRAIGMAQVIPTDLIGVYQGTISAWFIAD